VRRFEELLVGRWVFAGAVLAAAAGATVAAVPQQPAQPAQRARGVVQAGVQAVLVDVVIHDRKGEPVRDLTQNDFHITEDGVPQTVGSFTAIMDSARPDSARPAAAPTEGGTALPSTAIGSAAPVAEGPIVTAFVFDRLTPESRRLAVKAAQNYFGTKEEAPGYVGIFSVDLGLAPFAPFTRDLHVLRAALNKMAERVTSDYGGKDARDKAAQLEQAADAASQTTAQQEASAGRGGSNVGTGAGDAMLAQMQADMIRDFDALERDQMGYATTDALFAVIEQMRHLPGRKAIVLFSEGVALPPAVKRLFDGVTDSANRANVAIYTMDAAGLRAESEQVDIRDQVNRAGSGGGGILGGGKTGGGALTKSLEYNEDVLRQDPRYGLSTLARDTGGAAFDSTNNLRSGFDRIDSDQHNYYLLGYTSTNDKLDGRFRMIDVKVTRPGVTVSSRKGYYAVRDPGGTPVNSWEAPALGLLEATPVPNAFPVRAASFLFPETARPGLAPVIVDFKTAPLSFFDGGDGKTYASDFAVIVRYLDDKNNVVTKVSQHYEVKGPLAELERAKQGEVVFYREPNLPPGVYTMEAVVYDNPSGKASVRFATVEVPKVDVAGLRVSSLILTGRVEKVPEQGRRKDNPLTVDDVLIYPNLGDPVSKGAKELGFYFSVYPARGASAEATLDLLSNGKPIGQLPLTLASPDATGRIQQTGRLPIDQLAPGTYELQIVVKQGTTHVVRNATFRLME
jgi:VWFA-related protein